MNNNTTIFDRLIENKLELAKLLIYEDKILVESKIKGLTPVWINVWKSKIIKEAPRIHWRFGVNFIYLNIPKFLLRLYRALPYP